MKKAAIFLGRERTHFFPSLFTENKGKMTGSPFSRRPVFEDYITASDGSDVSALSTSSSEETVEFPLHMGTSLHNAWEHFHDKKVAKMRNDMAILQRKYSEASDKLSRSSQESIAEQKRMRDEMHDKVNKIEPFNEQTYSQVFEFSKKTVFRTFKFITDQETVRDYTKPGSPGDIVLKHFKIPVERRAQWWQRYSAALDEAINYSRHTTQTLIGKKFKGTSVAPV